MNMIDILKAKYVDVFSRTIYGAEITIENGMIKKITPCIDVPDQYIMPGFIDAHIHIESSMLTPPYFAQAALPHGTVATISDPHEIANVCGIRGVEYMLEAAQKTPLKFHFGAPSCVPATTFETAGATLDAEAVAYLMQRPDIFYLSEVMNFPAVLNKDPEMMKKLASAKEQDKPIDGHAPGMRYPQTETYFSAGISTDHECFELEEALDKIKSGCKILIREGSAAKNYEALKELFKTHPSSLMFCSDDLHPDDLLKGHINKLVKRAIKDGYDMYDVLYAACIHPVLHYKMKVGLLREGDMADFIIVKDLKDFQVLETWLNGIKVTEKGESYYKANFSETINNFAITSFDIEELNVPTQKATDYTICRVIEALDGQLITRTLLEELPIKNGFIEADPERDILKIVVVNRYNQAKANICFIKNFGLKGAAIASTVAHDSHNIVAVGSDDKLIAEAVKTLIQSKGGVVYVDSDSVDVLPLEVGGLMTNTQADLAGKAYERLTQKAKNKGCLLHAPFMTLSFMALPVIPSLKITDKGLFDTDMFNFISLEV